jgi:hypothetical protein
MTGCEEMLMVRTRRDSILQTLACSVEWQNLNRQRLSRIAGGTQTSHLKESMHSPQPCLYLFNGSVSLSLKHYLSTSGF